MDKISDNIMKRAEIIEKTIILPEGKETRILKAAEMVLDLTKCNLIIIANEEETIKKHRRLKNDRVRFVDVLNVEENEKYAQAFYEMRKEKGVTIEKAREIMKNPQYLATMIVKMGEADGLVSGSVTHTADVLRPAFQIIKTVPGISKASSCFIMELQENSPYAKNGNGGLIFADCGVIPKPTAEELKDIAITSSEICRVMLQEEPRVAFLSYSTKSGDEMEEEDVCRVKKAVMLTKMVNPRLKCDGELQVDAALDPVVAKLKSPKSNVAGSANVLVFPDLSSGNIAYKMAQRIAGIQAVGPILIGLNKPINDLSRGCTVEEIVICVAVTLLQCK